MLVVVAAFVTLTSACGISVSAGPRDHTLFQSLTVTGSKRTGAPLTAALAYQQYLPVDIIVRCELRQGKQLIKPLGQETVPQDPDGSPKATPFPGNVSFDFTVDAPGEYKVQCFTPSDEDNAISRVFSVQGAPLTPVAVR